MICKLTSLLLAVALSIVGVIVPRLAALAAPPTGASPCSHLTIEDASSATGVAFHKAEVVGKTPEQIGIFNACTYEGPPVGHGFPITVQISIMQLQGKDLITSLKDDPLKLPHAVFEPVPGVGDEAYFFISLQVRKGRLVYDFAMPVAAKDKIDKELLIKMAKAYHY